MFTKNNWDYNLWMELWIYYGYDDLTLQGNPPPLKFFNHGAILLKFGKEHFHAFVNNNWDYNFLLGAP